MNKLLLILVTLINVSSLLVMEHDIQPSSMTLSQLYYHFSHDLGLLPEIAQHIFSLQCGDVNLAEIEQNSKSPELLIKYIRRLISSCGCLLASEICESYFKHNKISICDIKDEYKQTCLHFRYSSKVTQILLKIAGDDKNKLLTMQTTGGWTALHSATYHNDTDYVKLFLDAADKKAYELIAMQTDEGFTTLHVAVSYHPKEETIKFLLNATGDKAQDLIMIPDKAGETAFDFATSEIKELMQSYMTNNKTT